MWLSQMFLPSFRGRTFFILFLSPTCSRYPLPSGHGFDAHPSADEILSLCVNSGWFWTKIWLWPPFPSFNCNGIPPVLFLKIKLCFWGFFPHSGDGCIRSGWVLAVAAVPPAASTKGEAFLCILPDLPFKNLRGLLEKTLKGSGKYLVCVALSVYTLPLVHTHTYYFITNF